MHISMNGPTGPGFPVPTWVLVSESILWEHGLPDAIPTANGPAGSGGNPALVVFATRNDAEMFADRLGIADVKPLALKDVMLFLTILDKRVGEGLRHVALFCPGSSSGDVYECDAVELLRRLSEAVSRQRR